MNKKILAAAVATTILGAGVLSANGVFAQTTPTDQNPMSALADKIASRFGLNRADVQAVFDEQQQEQAAKHRANQEAQLTQLVTDGKITEAQKQLIIAKRAELYGWAKQNNIGPQYLKFRGPGRGPGMHGGQQPATTVTSQ